MNKILIILILLITTVTVFPQKYIGVREANDSSVYSIVPFDVDVHVFTNGNIMTGTKEEIMAQAQALGLSTDTVVKNMPIISLRSNAIKADTILLLQLMTEYYKHSWSIVGDASKLNFINTNSIDYRKISNTQLDNIMLDGKYSNFHLYLRIPANQLNVVVPANVPGKTTNVTTWADWANKRPLIVRNSGGAVIVPLESKVGYWWNGTQIATIMAANANFTRYTDINWENQLGNATWFKVNTCTESITGRSDFYTYTEWSNFVLLAKK